MIFDQLLKLRRYFPPKINKLINRARVFLIDDYPTRAVQWCGNMDERSIREVSEDFHLPFPIVAVEDKISCVLIEDRVKGAVGLGNKRIYLDCMPIVYDSHPDAYREDEQATLDEYQELVRDFPDGSIIIVMGAVNDVMLTVQDGKLQWHMNVSDCVTTVMHPDHGPLGDPLKVAGGRHGGMNAKTAYEELIEFQNTSNFIMERKPVERKGKKKRRSGKRTTRERPIYTIVNAKRARQIMKLPEPSHEQGRIVEERRAHWRRAHERTLRNPRYKKARGKTIEVPRTFIPAVWHGPSEATVGQHRYRVILEKEPKNVCEVER